MTNTPLSIFISYSRTDSKFVDRLEEDLKQHGFSTWVDRRKIEGGQNWTDELQKALDRCQVCLVIISQEAVDSKWVKMEYRYALSKGKTVIPVNHRPTNQVLIDLNPIQWVNFQNRYENG